jgi:hypothetical protein
LNLAELEATGNDRGTVHEKLSGCRKMKIFTLFFKNISSLKDNSPQERVALWLMDGRQPGKGHVGY